MLDPIALLVYAVFLPLLHDIGDHVIQTGHQAVHKEKPGRAGAWACAKHIVTYHLLIATLPTAGVALFGFPFNPPMFAAALALSVITHYWADRREGFHTFIRRLGRGGFLDHVTVVRNTRDIAAGHPAAKTGPGTGGYTLDQIWHRTWLHVCAALLAIA